jgi:mRNA-degrading endonuclease RelE of RelBE toxin-antitoxin system
MAATGKGKRGAYRIIYYFFYEHKIYLLKIYSKSIKDSITESEKKEIHQLIQMIKNC